MLTQNPKQLSVAELIKSDGKKEYVIENSDKHGQIRKSKIFAQNDEQAKQKFLSSQLGARRTIIKVEETKKPRKINYKGISAQAVFSAVA